MRFSTYTPVDWNSKSDKILFKEKIGENYDKIYMTKLYVYDLSTESIFDLNTVRTTITNHWAAKGVFLVDYKWDIMPLGFMGQTDKIAVKAFGYYKDERKFLGIWAVDSRGHGAYLLSLNENYNPEVSANGKCLKFVPDIVDIVKKQRRIDAKTKSVHIEPK